VIKRIFGVVKRKYKILRSPSKYSMDTQSRIIIACCILYNFVRSIEGQSADILLEPTEELNTNQPTTTNAPASQSSKTIDKLRDKIAEKMWNDYQRYNTERQRDIKAIVATINEEEAQ
jgi:hypothetical protein